jgi:hypothetical protein
MICVIFGFIVHIETQLKILSEMMKEHTMYRTRLCDKTFEDNPEKTLDK